MTETDRLLTQGLAAGYGAEVTKPETVLRGDFLLKASDFKPDNDPTASYHDEWLPGRVGGGQELVTVGGQKATRLYAGGTISPEQLKDLGLTEDHVIGYLRGKITDLGGATRLHQHCMPLADGKWQYSYVIAEHLKNIDLTVGVETVRYDGQQVFAHGFLISPVE